jgi:hypothetical protein
MPRVTKNREEKRKDEFASLIPQTPFIVFGFRGALINAVTVLSKKPCLIAMEMPPCFIMEQMNDALSSWEN